MIRKHGASLTMGAGQGHKLLECSTQLQLGSYNEQLNRLPSKGNVLQAQYSSDEVVVYQAYNKHIASWAVQHQSFVGAPGFSWKRTSWIKPNFTWMMYRCGWGEKDEGQARILAMRVKKTFWDEILMEAVSAIYNNETRALYESKEEWQSALRQSNVVMQWDPDHEPFSNAKYPRRAIQLGIRGDLLKRFMCDPTTCTDSMNRESGLVSIEDITGFVTETKKKAMHELKDKELRSENVTVLDLLLPIEVIYPIPEHLSVYNNSG
eukprot:CAMPEP_0204619808 /NCGR_PEP_ID=MMETSP0717-20131115/6050_1 /ASSEMBLY_ACC=CAM_ASM_000666 /TAXON_ID=230516 /ORGANISM="Chaetoceros curvisetus" /LENGTH=263 /DNA_ID=CAMNT_0051633873 /DNA_START=127 /DNA_END=918 /DNA_ORIENTATION=+